ncbi:hypothetical protein AB0J80_28750 [Actinoplanes sp. NPDC049548]|uniref:hypothetical protein n=1 Tax=Actinoplanes sp. NPDC049548 TaxID=3155152 RepID=UPI0034154F43
MQRRHVLSLAAAAAVTVGVFATAWPASADVAPAGNPPSSAEPSDDPPLPPGHPIPSGPATGTPPPADPSVTPPAWPSLPPDDPEDQ